MIAAPLNERLFSYYQRAPEYLGSVTSLDLFTEHGKRFARIGDRCGVRACVSTKLCGCGTWRGAWRY
jgi:hypothetical protein